MKRMDYTPQEAAHSLLQLQEALSNVDKDAYPERANEIQAEIDLLERQIAEASVPKIEKTAKVIFHGNGKEYFRIWIVNLLLTILTLGIYSAWATVRNNRYFYSNTEIDGHRFSYLAEPMQILTGRIIGVLLFAAYFLASSFSPIAGLVVMLVLFALVPVLVCLSASFKMRMTAYRNIRFNFNKNYGRAYVVFVGYALIGIVSLGLLYPWMLKKIDEFIHSHVTYGDRHLVPKLDTREYYAAGILAFLSALGIGFLGGVLMAASGELAMAEPEQLGLATIIGTFLIYALVFVVSASIYQARIRNHIYNNSELSGVATFKSNVSIGGLIMLRLTNLIMLIVSLGFLMPWIKVRTTQFFVDATEINIQEGAESVLADQTQTGNAIGEEVAGVFDVDIAIG